MEKQLLDLDKYERFIFDIDGTLLFGNYEREKEYFMNVLKEKGEPFLQNLVSYLDKYEKIFPRYSSKVLSTFFLINSNIYIEPDIIEGWIDVNCNMEDKVEESAIETLEYLKSRNKSIVALTNWFSKTQISRLKNSNLLKYIDEVYGGDLYLKPNPESYINAKGNFDIDRCVMIGDDIEKDYLGPRKVGMHSILYNSKGITTENNDTIKSLRKIIER